MMLLILILLMIRESQQQALSVSDISLTWINRGNQTDFTLTSPLDGKLDLNNAWLSVALNDKTSMVSKIYTVNHLRI